MLDLFEVVRGKGLREGQLAKTGTLGLGLGHLRNLIDASFLEMLGHLVGRGIGLVHCAIHGLLEGVCRVLTFKPTGAVSNCGGVICSHVLSHSLLLETLEFHTGRVFNGH